MMTQNKKASQTKFNRVGYGVFIAAGLYFLATGDYSQSFLFWSLALVFDPFDQSITFSNRKAYQQIWLIVHVIMSLLCLALMLKNSL